MVFHRISSSVIALDEYIKKFITKHLKVVSFELLVRIIAICSTDSTCRFSRFTVRRSSSGLRFWGTLHKQFGQVPRIFPTFFLKMSKLKGSLQYRVACQGNDSHQYNRSVKLLVQLVAESSSKTRHRYHDLHEIPCNEYKLILLKVVNHRHSY